MFYSLWHNAPKLLPAGGLERGGTDYVFGMKDVARLKVELHPSYRTHSQCLRVPGHRPATTWVHYATSSKT
jgi:hypothetical protein